MARKILLADDSVTAQNMGRRILSDAGYDVTTVNNGSAALKKIAEHKPDLIVLDVYMPGYGGLEVCQRLKENRETARIPILLTVGKLEPFKPDEARRVRADAFIIKPFEASELLTALTKLEDKIVPQAETYKPGRFARAIAAVDQITEKGDGFGDSETGWKERLKIPSGKPSSEPEPENLPGSNTKFRELDRGKDFKPVEASTTFERPIPAGVPQDITPEEIAAIAAAAASFSGNGEAVAPTPPAETAPVTEVKAVAPEATATVAPEPPKTEAIAAEVASSETPAATFASAPEATEPAPTAAATSEVTAAAAESVPAPASPEVESIPAPAAEEKSEAKPGEESAAIPDEPMADPDVLAAIASLIPALPSNGQGYGVEANAACSDTNSEKREAPFSVASAIAQLAGVGAVASGARWIAEEVPVESDEAALILEREMEKALAAMAEAESAATAAAVQEAPAPFANRTELEVATTVAEIPPSASLETITPVTTEAAALAEVVAAPAPETSVTPVETVATSTVEASASETKTDLPAPVEAVAEAAPAPEPATATVEAVASATVPAEEVSANASTPAVMAETTTSEPKAEAALAVAAGAGSGSAEAIAVPEAIAQGAVPAATAESMPVPYKPDDHKEADLDAATAAAWENWQHIRESVVGSDLTAQVTDAAAATLQEIKGESPARTDAAEPDTEGAGPSSASDSNAIASIVDSVLAELKPKLVEEIARKMGNEKDKKKKKK